MTIDPSKHAYKNARVKVLGWCLTPEETARVAASDQAEIALQERPTHIKVQVNKPKVLLSSGEKANDLIVVLTPKVIQWSRDRDDKAKVRRIGFPLVPDFGGTVHGYCGTTLDASISDLLEWTRRPTMDDMQRAYINESRIREAQHLLIAQPYSPQLFRQGQLPGPRILMDVLRRDLNLQQAEAAWSVVEAEKEQRPTEYDRWPLTMQLPCRTCTLQNGGIEVRKMLKGVQFGAWVSTALGSRPEWAGFGMH